MGGVEAVRASSSYSRICVLGDFNSIRASSEQGANRGSQGREVVEFNQFIEDM